MCGSSPKDNSAQVARIDAQREAAKMEAERKERERQEKLAKETAAEQEAKALERRRNQFKMTSKEDDNNTLLGG